MNAAQQFGRKKVQNQNEKAKAIESESKPKYNIIKQEDENVCVSCEA
jgi:hypothetical protein